MEKKRQRHVQKMKLLWVAVAVKKEEEVTLLASAHSSHKHSKKKTFAECLTKILERSTKETRSSVSDSDHGWVCHAYVRKDGLGGGIVSDEEYPENSAHTILTKLLADFNIQNREVTRTEQPSTRDFMEMKEYLEKYQDPKSVDPLMRVRAELDETKVVLHRTVESALQRGQKLDFLVEKSEDLAKTAALFQRTARKINRRQCCCCYIKKRHCCCCSIM